ncbi:MAG: thioredoxin family protein [Phycisphaerales bacterium]|nr:thioredoxin family protein [Phycisphaerales bacterium]
MLRFSLAVFTLAVVPAWAQPKAPEVHVALHANVAAIAPGKPFDVAISFEIPEEFHIYWENPGDSGMPPKVKWQLPEGFNASGLRFPAPTREEQAGIVSYVLKGSPVLLATITPPDNLPVGEKVTLTADVRWLVCKLQCFLDKKTLSIELPTADAPKENPDEDESLLFRLAERSLPVATDKASDITLKASVSPAEVAKGDTFNVVLDVTVKPGFHTQSNKPLGEFFVPSVVFPRTVAGLTYEQPVWPDPHIRDDKVFGKVSEFGGEFKVTLPVKVESPTASKDVTVSGLFSYQACNDKGQCHPPQAVEWAVQVTSSSVSASATTEDVADGPVVAATDESASDKPATPGAANATPIAPAKSGLAGLGLIGAIIGGFLGGLILNIMPCVLPVISIKILSFVQQANEEPKRVFRLGLTFGAGIIVSFLVLAVGILWLQASTQTTRSWGSFFQVPGFVVAMIVVMFVFALNLFGVFEINLPGAATGKLAATTEREGYSGAFMKGVLATLLATPCTAPFLASAISYALASNNQWSTFIVFMSAGVGMAFPYVLLTARPAWMRYLPKPGTWMITFKQFMGFLLVGTAVWLLWILGALVGQSGVVWTVGFLAFCGLAAWVYGKIEFQWPTVRKMTYGLIAIAIVLGGGAFAESMYIPLEQSAVAAPVAGEDPVAHVDWSGDHIPWIAYRPDLARELATQGYTVYVDYTAAWCLTCQANKKLVLDTEAMRAEMRERNVVPIKADFTRHNPDIADDLKAFNRDAVPLNVVYPASKPDSPIVLPVVLTHGRVVEALDEAGASTKQLAQHTDAKKPVQSAGATR